MNAKEFYRSPTLLLPAPTAFFFFVSVLLAYLAGGFFLQTHLGLAGIFLNQFIFLGIPTYFFAALHQSPLFRWKAWQWPGLKPVLLTLLLTLGVSLSVDFLIAWQDRLWPSPPEMEAFYKELIAFHSGPEVAAKILVLALTPAFFEEVFFRGILQPNWVNRFGKPLGIFFVSLAFAVAHTNLWHFHFYFILSLFLGLLFEWKDSLWLPILGHLVNNLWTLFSPGS